MALKHGCRTNSEGLRLFTQETARHQHLQATATGLHFMGRTHVLLMISVLLSSGLSGCVFDDSTGEPPMMEDVRQINCDGASSNGWNLSCPFPSFNLTDDEGQPHGTHAVNNTGRWIAYVSATWCTHCLPTLDALDRAVEAGHLLVMNKDSSDDNMSSWKATMEHELNRTLRRPFLHAPEVAGALGVEGVPHVVLVENHTVLAVRVGLWDDVDGMERWFHSSAPETGYSSEID